MPTVARAEGQLDLFADLDAAATAATEAEAEAQRRFGDGPALFDDLARGFFARVGAAEAWSDQHGHFDCLRRSITLTADLRCDHYRAQCSCVGELIYRGACLHCDCEGEIRDSHHGAVEDAPDHAWPGWRDLPCVPRRPEPGTSATHKNGPNRWVETTSGVYPEGWLESGGPIRTVRSRYDIRHVPDHTGFGGYDLCGDVGEQVSRT